MLLCAAIVVSGMVSAPSAAPTVQLSIRDGRVWLKATDASVSQILAEWARVGKTRIVNGERVPGGPVTLQLNGVPEQQALEVLLRSAGGFIAAARTAPASTESRFDRIVIVPTSSRQAPEPVRAAAPPFPQPVAAPPVFPQPVAIAPPTTPGVQRVIGPDGQPVPDDQEDAPGAPPRQPFVSLPPGFATDAPAAPQPQAQPAAPSATPGSPAGAAVPGMIVPPPSPPQTERGR